MPISHSGFTPGVLYLTIAGVSSVYALLLLWLRGGIRPQARRSNEAERPMVSVIVAARNEADNLPNLLGALNMQDYPRDRFEVVIADDGSTDATPNILQSAADAWPNLKHVTVASTPAGWAPKKWALNQAIDASSGSLLLMLDADCSPPATWISSVVAGFDDEKVGMVVGPAPLVWDNDMPWRKALELDSQAIDAVAAAGLGRRVPLTCTGRNLALRRQVFEEIDGYRGVEAFISGDDDLIMHKVAATDGWEITFRLEAEAVNPSPQPATFGQFVSQRLRFASKGPAYFRLNTSAAFKLVLVTMFLGKLAGAAALLAVLLGYGFQWLAVWVAVMLAEGWLVRTYYRAIGAGFPLLTFIATGLVYPFYIVIFGILGGLLPIRWKGRSSKVKAA